MTASSTTGPSFSSIGALGGGGGATTAAYTANSHNFIPPTTQHVPAHQAHVYVEHANGAFVPLGIHTQIENKQHMDQVMASRAFGGSDGGGTAWNFHEDAKDYVERLENLMKFLRRLLDMLSGLACGFSLFKVLDVYTSSMARSNEVFLATYAHSSAYIPKCYMLLCLLLVVLSLLPMGFDLAMQSLAMLTFGTQFSPSAQRTTLHQRGQAASASVSGNLNRNVATSGDGTSSAVGAVNASRVDQSQQSGVGRVGRFGRLAQQIAANTYHRFFRFLGFENPADSPFRHLIQVRFVMFVAALGITIFEVSIVDQRFDALATSLTSTDVDRLHAATLTRAGLFAIAWLFSLKEY